MTDLNKLLRKLQEESELYSSNNGYSETVDRYQRPVVIARRPVNDILSCALELSGDGQITPAKNGFRSR